MNKQQHINKDGSIGRGIEWCDYTWNPIRGCLHGCAWQMPDGSIANCYAEDVADRVAGRAYPEGFEHHYWTPGILDEPLKLKQPARIFVGSMADVFGHWVPKEQILDVLEVCNKAHWHTFQFLTKNPKRVLDFVGIIPKNCWIGASTPPNFMWNKPMKPEKRAAWLDVTLKTLGGIRDTGLTTWLSAEPITIDVSMHLHHCMDSKPVDWMVIGAASNGKTLYAPDENWVQHAVEYADLHGIAPFFKGNLRSLPWAVANWREEFPVFETMQP